MKDAIGQEPIKSMKEKIEQIKRDYVKRKLTRNLGKVVETEDKLICYVKKNRLKKEKHYYDAICCGIYLKDKELARKYRLDKQVIYVFDGIDFECDRVYIFGYKNCEVVIRNCNFGSNLQINVDGKCTLENINIKNVWPITSIRARELIIKDTIIVNDNWGVTLSADEKLEINNSTIGNTNTKVYINSRNKLYMYNSKIIGNEVNCKADYIVSGRKDMITATKKFELESPKFLEMKVSSPMIICNGKTYNQSNSSISTLRQVKDLLKAKRLELLSLLKNVENIANIKNEADLKEYQSTLKKRPLKKVLAKRS